MDYVFSRDGVQMVMQCWPKACMVKVPYFYTGKFIRGFSAVADPLPSLFESDTMTVLLEREDSPKGFSHAIVQVHHSTSAQES